MKFFGDKYAKIKFFNVGHGDAILIESISNEDKIWRCLIDGGQGNKLHQYITELNIKSIDLLILSHLDFDHINGIIKLLEKTEINFINAWLPFIPAIKRYEWMFGKRTKNCLSNGQKLINLLKEEKTIITFPLEGFTYSEHNNAIDIQVISPAKRLIEILYFGDPQIENLLKIPLPIEDILENGTIDTELNQELGIFSIDPENKHFINNLPDRDFPITKIDIPSKQKEKICREFEYEPDWFGDHLLNDTSLVIQIKIHINGLQYKFLFTGDQENWTYILSKSIDLHTFDILKIPHHGSRIYFNKQEHPDEFIRHISPKYSVISVSDTGRFNLPRENTLDACIRYSENLFVTMINIPEHLNKYKFDEGYYFSDIYQIVNKNEDIKFSLPIEKGIEFIIANGTILTNKPSIKTGNLIPKPIIQYHTVIERELIAGEKARNKSNLDIILKVLEKLKNSRLHQNGLSLKDYQNYKVEQNSLKLKEIRTLLKNEEVELYDNDIISGINEGVKYGKIVKTNKRDHYRSEYDEWYLYPSQKDIEHFQNRISEYSFILLGHHRALNIDKFSLLNEIDWGEIKLLYSALSGFPTQVIEEYIIPLSIPYVINNYDIYLSKKPYVDNSRYNKDFFYTVFLSIKGKCLDNIYNIINEKKELFNSNKILLNIKEEGCYISENFLSKIRRFDDDTLFDRYHDVFRKFYSIEYLKIEKEITDILEEINRFSIKYREKYHSRKDIYMVQSGWSKYFLDELNIQLPSIILDRIKKFDNEHNNGYSYYGYKRHFEEMISEMKWKNSIIKEIVIERFNFESNNRYQYSRFLLDYLLDKDFVLHNGK